MIDLEKAFNGKKVLITGGLGFIGSNLAFKLVELGGWVSIMDSMIPGCGGNWFNIEHIGTDVAVDNSDMRHADAINHLVEGQDYIFNLAGLLSHIDSMRDPFTDLEINCKGQLLLLEACRRYNKDVKIVFAGTRGQYGKAKYRLVNERHLMCPIDINGINKMAAEKYHFLYNDIYGIRAVSLRMTNTYGPRHQMRHSRQGIINWFVRQLMDGEKVRLYGGLQIRDINYVDDVCDALLLAMAGDRTDGHAYNLSGEAFSLREIVEIMIRVYGKGSYEIIPFPRESKKIEVGSYVADCSKFKKDVNWAPKVPVQEGFKKTFEYYKKHKKEYWP